MTVKKNQQENFVGIHPRATVETGLSRREFLKAPATFAAASLILPTAIGNALMSGEAHAEPISAVLNPRYYPLENFVPDLDLSGKVAVITGASRGIGRATAEALATKGVEVIGTSRDPETVLNLPAYPLLELDITKPKSVERFSKMLSNKLRGRKLDILINNAGRFVLGPMLASGLDSAYYFAQLNLATETLYHGHIRVTNALLPLMPTQGYARLLYTVSSAAYLVSGTDSLTPWLQPYISAKRALLAYVNGLRRIFSESSSNIQISTINPYIIATTGAEHPHPIYLQPVTDSGFTSDPRYAPFNQMLAIIRQIQQMGLPAALVGDAYAQLCASAHPPFNVMAGSIHEPFASQGGTTLIESMILAENEESAVRFNCN